MFLRRNRRNRRTVDRETCEYWTLCRTVRTARGPRQEVVGHLGKEPGLDSASRHGWEEVAECWYADSALEDLLGVPIFRKFFHPFVRNPWFISLQDLG